MENTDAKMTLRSNKAGNSEDLIDMQGDNRVVMAETPPNQIDDTISDGKILINEESQGPSLFSGDDYFSNSDKASVASDKDGITVSEIEDHVTTPTPQTIHNDLVLNLGSLLKSEMGNLKDELKHNMDSKMGNLKDELKYNIKSEMGGLEIKLDSNMQKMNTVLVSKMGNVATMVENVIPIVKDTHIRSIKNEENILNLDLKMETIADKALNNEVRVDMLEEQVKGLNLQFRDLSLAVSTKTNIVTLIDPSQEASCSYSQPSASLPLFSSRRNQAAVINVSKIPDLPIFNGNNFLPGVFLQRAEACFDTAGVYADLDKIQAFKLLITGKVQNWLLGCKPELSSWEQLKKAFLKQWQNPFSIQRMVNNWKQAKINRDTDIEAFILEGLRLLEAIYPSYSFQQIAEEIISKLPAKISESIMLRYPQFLNEAQFLEAVQHTLRVVDWSDSQTSNRNSQTYNDSTQKYSAPNYQSNNNERYNNYENRPNYNNRQNYRGQNSNGRGYYNNTNRGNNRNRRNYNNDRPRRNDTPYDRNDQTQAPQNDQNSLNQ